MNKKFYYFDMIVVDIDKKVIMQVVLEEVNNILERIYFFYCF